MILQLIRFQRLSRTGISSTFGLDARHGEILTGAQNNNTRGFNPLPDEVRMIIACVGRPGDLRDCCFFGISLPRPCRSRWTRASSISCDILALARREFCGQDPRASYQPRPSRQFWKATPPEGHLRREHRPSPRPRLLPRPHHSDKTYQSRFRNERVACGLKSAL